MTSFAITWIQPGLFSRLASCTLANVTRHSYLETSETEHCLAAHRSQPTPNHLFWDVRPLAVPPFCGLVSAFFFLITKSSSFRHRPRPTFGETPRPSSSTRLRPSIRTVPTTSHERWFRDRQTPELLLYYLPGTMVPRSTNAGLYSRTTTQRPSTPTTTLPVRISSLGNGTPETGNLTRWQKQRWLYSMGSRLAPLTRRVANESSPFGLGISHRIHQLPTSFRPFPTRWTNSAAPPPPLQRDRFPLSTSVADPSLPPRRTCRFPLALLHPDVLPRAALLRSPTIPPKPRPTDCTLLTTRDPAEPLCSGPVFPVESHRLATFLADWRIAVIPSTGLGWLPRQRHRSILDTPPSLPGLQDASPLLHRLPGNPNASETPSAPPSPPIFRRRTLRNSNRSPNHNKPTVERSRPSSLATLPLT